MYARQLSLIADGHAARKYLLPRKASSNIYLAAHEEGCTELRALYVRQRRCSARARAS